MKEQISIVIFGLLLVSASAISSLDDQLRELVETLRQQMPCGVPSLGVPPLAPYTNKFIQYDLNNVGIDIAGNISDLIVTGLNGFEVKELNYATLLMKFNFDVNFSQIKFFSQYYAKGNLQIFGKPIPMVGDGDFDLVIENLRINGSFRIRPTKLGGIKIWGFQSSLNLDQVKSKTTGILNSKIYSRIINRMIEELLKTLVDDHKEEIANITGNYVVPFVNGLLKDVTLLDLVGLILGYGSSGPSFPVCEVN